MPRDLPTLLFVGIRNSVVALDSRTGAEVWRTKLKGSDFVTVLWDGESLFAANAGEVWGLDHVNGSVRWHNQFKGLGLGLVNLASSRSASSPANVTAASAKKQRDAQAAAAAAG